MDYFTHVRCFVDVDKCDINFAGVIFRGDVDFLEFMISVWNVCTCRMDSLSNFAFDMYDLDSDGELSVPEIEQMVWEFFGKGGGGKCLEDASKYAEHHGGAMKL